ncbi:MAG: T9SS type A sorting domain-containing protein [candidate division Zixibacteria bacterium]|jgi:hypothetical protein|nr:T9SS type A sorting domain-containing protein [candidate division Zixibacteria bacterium]
MTKTLMIILVVSGILLAGSVSAQYTGIVSIDSIEAEPGDQVAVPIWMSGNNDQFSGAMLPIRFDHAALTLDSISLSGSVFPAGFSGQVHYDGYSDGWIITVIPPFGATPPPAVDDAEGLLCSVFFSVADPLAPGAYGIDSVNVDSSFTIGSTEFHFWRRMEFISPDARTLLPGFESGQVFVRVTTAVGDEPGSVDLPTSYGLAQNYPNPFNPSTIIEFSLPSAGPVSLLVYNVLGQEVSALVNRHMEAGVHSVTFDASGFPSGVYFYRLSHEGGSLTKKMTFVK